MTRKQRRLWLVSACGAVLVLATGLILTALSSKVTFFFTPSTLAAAEERPERPIRVGGLVADGSVGQAENGHVYFSVTDNAAQVKVIYAGVLPDLFREGQGVVVEGRVQPDGHVQASQVLAKHDENYMPPEVAKALKEQGVWKHGPEELKK